MIIVCYIDILQAGTENIFEEVKFNQREPQIKLNGIMFVLLGCKNMYIW